MDFQRIKMIFFPALLISIFCFLTACASSNVSRNAGSQIDSITNPISASGSRISDAYQNANQTSKGMLIGGVAGGAAGGFTSGVGVVPGALTGAVFGGALGAYIDSQTTLVDKLENRGVKVIVLGDQVMIILFSDQIFQGRGPVLRGSAYETLDLVAELINGYTSMSIRVAAYTADIGSQRINSAVTQEQAGSIVRYLWRRGVNTRMLYAIGMGGTHLVEKNTGSWNSGENYRVEITLEKLPT